MAIINTQIKSQLGLQGKTPKSYDGTSKIVQDTRPGEQGGETTIKDSLYDLDGETPETYLEILNKELSTKK